MVSIALRAEFLGESHPGLTVVGSRLGTASSVVPKVEPCRIGRLVGSPLIFSGCSPAESLYIDWVFMSEEAMKC